MKLCFWNGEMICASNVEYNVNLPGHQWFDAPIDYDSSKVYKYEDSQIQEVPIIEYDPKRLRVHRVLPMNMDPLISDFTILGFKKMAPHYDRGRKIKAEYKCVLKDELIVEKIFTDIRDPGTGRLTDLQVLFNWYAEDGTIELSKTETVKTFNKAQSETMERNRRERSLDFLISEGRGTAIEPIMDILFAHYHDEQLVFKEKGNSNFADAINNETDPTINGYLDIRVPFASDPLNYDVPIRESILYQIKAIDEAALMAVVQPIGL